jgi:hypothetical protein
MWEKKTWQPQPACMARTNGKENDLSGKYSALSRAEKGLQLLLKRKSPEVLDDGG